MTESVLTQTDNGKTVEIRPGGRLVVRLNESPTTGFAWTVKSTGDLLALQGSDFTPAGNAVGAGGLRTFTFAAQQAGDGALELKLWRPWEGDASIRAEFSVQVQVVEP